MANTNRCGGYIFDTVKYFYPKEVLKGKAQLIAAGGNMILEVPITFSFTREGKWNSTTFNTGSMINAGNYIVKLILENAEGLAVSGTDIQ